MKEFLKRYVTERGIKDAILNPVSGGKCWIESIWAVDLLRTASGFHETQDRKFQDFNSNAKIVVTSNPDLWEGKFFSKVKGAVVM